MHKHKILTFLLSIVVATLLWVYAVTVINPDDKTSIRGVPVRIVGANELQMSHLMLTGGEGQTVDVEISGRRSDLKELNNTTLEAVADVSKLDGAGIYELSWTLDPPSTVASGDIKLVSSSANKIKVKISEYQHRPEIPVQIDYVGALAEGFVRDEAVTNRETISLSGPAEEVEQIRFARVTVDLADTKVSLDQELNYELVDQEGQVLTLSEFVTVDDPVLRVMVPVFCYKQIKLDIELLPGGGATAEDVVYTIDPPSIGVVGDESSVKAMPDTMIIKQFKLGDITDPVSVTLTPEFPTGVSNRDTENSVLVNLSLQGLTTKKFYINCSQIQRSDESVPLDFAVARISITVRGKAMQVNALDPAKIQITADMENDYDMATKTVRLKVSLSEDTGCGILGSYTVPVVDRIEETVPNETESDS